MRTAAVAFLASAVTAGALTPAVRDLARRRGMLDHALSSRKVHGQPIPRLGGVAIVAAFILPLTALFFVNSDVGQRLWVDPVATVALFAGGLCIAALGVVDDLRGTGARAKFAIQFLVAAGMYAAGYRIDEIAIPFGDVIQLGWLGLPFTMLWIAGVVNALNLIDGLDGLAAGVALVAVSTLFVTSAVRDAPVMVLISAALAGSLVGFLFYNFNPATIFMGDSGSMFIGFVLAVTAITSRSKSPTAVALVVPLIVLAVPIADTLLAMMRRAVRGVPLFSADQGHIHHRLLARGLTHRQTVLAIYGASALLGAAALVVSFATWPFQALVLVVLGLAGGGALKLLGFLDLEKAQVALVDRRRNLDMRATVRRAAELLREARAPVELWQAVREVAPALGACAVRLELGRLQGHPGSGPFEQGFDDLPAGALVARYGLIPERPGADHVELAWADGRASVGRDTEIAIELLCDHASTALDRIERTAAQGPNLAAIGAPK